MTNKEPTMAVSKHNMMEMSRRMVRIETRLVRLMEHFHLDKAALQPAAEGEDVTTKELPCEH